MEAARIDPDILLSHADFVRALARSLLADAHAAEDVAQDALTAALDRPPRSESSLRSWLGRVTHNFARQSLRREDRRGVRERAAARGESLPGPAQILEREAARAAVVRALLDLPDPTRTVLILHYDEGLSARAIATRLALPVETVRTRIRRGLARMRADLEEREGGSGGDWMSVLTPLAALPTARWLPSTGLGNAVLASTAAKLGAAAVALAIALVAWRALGSDPGAAPPTGAPSVPTLAQEERRDASPEAQEVFVDDSPTTVPSQERTPAAAHAAPASAHEDAAAIEKPALRGRSLLGRFMRPDGGDVFLENAVLRLTGARGGRREVSVAEAKSILVPDLEPDTYTLRLLATSFEHRGQTVEIPGRKDSDSDEAIDEPVVVWPRDWIAVVVLTPDGRSFEEIADELGIGRKPLLVDAFTVRTRGEPPDEHAWSATAPPEPAIWHPPRVYQSWSLPGACAGSLQVWEPLPFWAGLSVHGKSLGWELVSPGATEVVFRLATSAFEESLATVSMRVLDGPRAPRNDVRVTLKANTSAHRRQDQSKVQPGPDGRVKLAHVVPGRYELTVEGGDALHQELLEIAPGETRDLGDIVLAAGLAVPIHVVDGTGAPASGWVEIAPYRENAHVDDLYPPNLHRSLDAKGEFRLPMPSEVSIVRITLEDPVWHHQSTNVSANVLLDPARPPAGTLEFVVPEAIEVRFDFRPREGSRIEVRDELDLVVATPPLEGKKALRAQLVPGRYLARRVDAADATLAEAPFVVADRPLEVQLP